MQNNSFQLLQRNSLIPLLTFDGFDGFQLLGWVWFRSHHPTFEVCSYLRQSITLWGNGKLWHLAQCYSMSVQAFKHTIPDSFIGWLQKDSYQNSLRKHVKKKLTNLEQFLCEGFSSGLVDEGVIAHTHLPDLSVFQVLPLHSFPSALEILSQDASRESSQMNCLSTSEPHPGQRPSCV